MVDPARRVERAMREAKFCAECNDSIPRAGRHAVPNIGIFVCNRCYGVFREGMSLRRHFNVISILQQQLV